MSIMRNYRRIGALFRNHVPGQLIIQLTDKCNALCPQCGMRRTAPYKRSRLSLNAVKSILDACAEKGVEAVSFTGGEPLIFFDDVIELLKHAGRCGIRYTRTGTNGFMFMGSEDSRFEERINRMAEKLASTNLYTFWISLDSVDSVIHECMRGLPGVVAGIRKALPILARYGIYPSANLGINWNLTGDFNTLQNPEISEYHYFRSGFRRFYQYVLNLGFTIVNACYPMSSAVEGVFLDPVYQAISSDRIVSFTPMEKRDVFRALFDTIPEFRDRIRIFSPRSSLLQLIRYYSGQTTAITPCRGGIDYFYIDAVSGSVFPCGYRGNDDLGEFKDMGFPQLTDGNACYRCDWECFRDPSVMLDPFIQMIHRPFGLIKNAIRDPEYYRTWIEDLSYYRACDFFNARNPPDYRRLMKFNREDPEAFTSIAVTNV